MIFITLICRAGSLNCAVAFLIYHCVSSHNEEYIKVSAGNRIYYRRFLDVRVNQILFAKSIFFVFVNLFSKKIGFAEIKKNFFTNIK